MRLLRPLARRDARRAALRLRYRRYMASPHWRQRREQWLADHQTHHHNPPACVICDQPWTLDDDLHHATYATLGRERHHDLVPMCRPCHEHLHQILDHSKHWRTINRATATRQLVEILRQKRDRLSNEEGQSTP